jgi:hypothetical protein
MENNIISYKEWEEKYKPVNDVMFDFYKEADEILPSINHLWTAVDNNPNSVYLDILPGRRVVNSLGYYVTEVPWTDVELLVSDDPES